jgi:hypothetical protein
MERQRDAHAFDGCWFDGVAFGNTMDATCDMLNRLRVRGFWIGQHDTVAPNQNAADGTPWAQLSEHSKAEAGRILTTPRSRAWCNFRFWGETMEGFDPGKEDPHEYLKRVSDVEGSPHVLPGYYPPPKCWFRGHPERFFGELPGLLMAHYVSASEPVAAFRDLFLSEWKQERAKYEADPDGYVRAMAEKW